MYFLPKNIYIVHSQQCWTNRKAYLEPGKPSGEGTNCKPERFHTGNETEREQHHRQRYRGIPGESEKELR